MVCTNAGLAAEAIGDKTQAKSYFTALLESTDRGSHSARPEFDHVKAFESGAFTSESSRSAISSAVQSPSPILAASTAPAPLSRSGRPRVGHRSMAMPPALGADHAAQAVHHDEQRVRAGKTCHRKFLTEKRDGPGCRRPYKVPPHTNSSGQSSSGTLKERDSSKGPIQTGHRATLPAAFCARTDRRASRWAPAAPHCRP